MGKAKKLGTQQVILGVEDSENFTKARALEGLCAGST